MNPNKPPGKIITFYSYKGGTGRSMALANTAWILASNRKRVLVLDWDLEAPGLQRYFRPFLIDKDLTASEGVIDFLAEFAVAAVTPLGKGESFSDEWYERQAGYISRYIVSLNFKRFPKGGSIDFIPAGKQGLTYSTRFTSFDFQNFYTRLGGGKLIEKAKQRLRDKYDYILVDSRTGVSDSAGICTVQLPDLLVVCFTFNNQSIDGAGNITQSAVAARAELEKSKDYEFQSKLLVYPVPMRADATVDAKLKRRKRFARWKFNPYLSHIAASDHKTYWGEVEVPYVAAYAYEEILAPFNDDPSIPGTVLATMVRLTRYLTGGEVAEFKQPLSPPEVDEILYEFASTPDATPETQALPESETVLERQLRVADETVGHLTPEEQEEARRLWTRLVRVPRPEERGENSKVRISREELSAGPALLQKFAAAQLLEINRDKATGEETVEAVNDELLRTWKQLKDWIKADREFLLWRQKLRVGMAEWERNKHDVSDLLSGRTLSEARRWFGERPGDLNEGEQHYVRTSIDRHRKRVRLYRQLAAAAAVIVVGLAVNLTYDWLRERRQQAEVAAKAAAAASSLTKEQQAASPQLKALLALEALRREPSSQDVTEILRQELMALPRRPVQIRTQTSVSSVAFNSSDSTLITVSGYYGNPNTQLAAAGREKVVQVWGVNGQEVTSIPLASDVLNATLSADGRYLATTRGEQSSGQPRYTVGMLDIGAKQPVSPSEPVMHRGAIFGMFFSQDSHYLATASDDNTVKIFDLQSAKDVRTIKLGGAAISAAFSADNQYLVTGSEDLSVRIWELATGRPIGSTLDKLSSPPSKVVFTTNGRYIGIVTDQSMNAMIWDWRATQNENNPRALSFDGDVNDLAFSPDSRYIAVASDDLAVKVFAVDTARSVNQLAGRGYSVAFSQNGRYLVATSATTALDVLGVDNGFGVVMRLPQEYNSIDVAFSGDGKYIATVGAGNIISLWELAPPLGADLAGEACTRLTRNLTQAEWQQYLPGESYRRTCQDLP